MCANLPGNRRSCCDITEVQFQVTAQSTHWFGVTVLGQNLGQNNNNRRPLAFDDSVTDFRVGQFQVKLSGNRDRGPAMGDTFMVDTDSLDRPLLLLRFLIGKLVYAFNNHCVVSEASFHTAEPCTTTKFWSCSAA